MKRVSSLFLVLLISTFVICGCSAKKSMTGGSDSANSSSNSSYDENELSPEMKAALSTNTPSSNSTASTTLDKSSQEKNSEKVVGIKPNTDSDELSPEMKAALSGSVVEQETDDLSKAISDGIKNSKKEININLEKYAKQQSLFEVNSDKLAESSHEGLDIVAKLLKENPNIKLKVEGHTDNIGKAEYNQQLSEKRAKSVANYLISKGIDSSRITTEGFGFSKPIASNDTEEGRAKNRRTELIFKVQD